MTSRNLFFKMIKQDIQKRIWCPIIIFLGYFLLLEVNMLHVFGMMEEDISRFYYKDLAEFVEKGFFGMDTKLFAALACCFAFSCAISGFAYLHSRVQIDAYNSLPVTRVQVFLARYVSGFLQFFIPFVLHVIICMGIAAGKAAFSGEAFTNALQMVGVVTLVFLMCYGVFILVSCLTGNVVINVLGCVTLFFYSAVASIVLNEMFEIFFDTYLIVGDDINMGFQSFFNFSPLSMLVQLFEQSNAATFQYNLFFKYNADRLWVIAVAAVVYTLAAFVLFWKRASEAAGKSIAFRWAEPVLKTLLVIPASLFCGMFFRTLATWENYIAWFLFGVFFGYVIVALLLEIVFRFDFKGAFCHKRQFVFNAACVAVIVIIFQYDVLGYDTYVPSDSELVSCSVSIEDLMSISPATKAGRHYYTYMGETDYRMSNVRIQGNPSVMDLARKAAVEQLQSDGTNDDYKSVVFGYNLKNGKSVYRTYVVNISDEETLNLLADIFNDSSYKVGTNPLLSEGWKKEYKKLYCTGTFNNAVLDMTPEFQSKLLETYQEEYLQLDFSTIFDTYPVGCIEPVTAEEYEASIGVSYVEFGRGNGNLIYPQFTKTIALLKENGFDVYQSIDMEDIDYISITYEMETKVYNSADNYYITYDTTEVGGIYNQEQQQQVLDCLMNSVYIWQVGHYADLNEENFHVYIHTKSNDESLRRNFYFRKGMVPDFVYELEGYQSIIAAQEEQ